MFTTANKIPIVATLEGPMLPGLSVLNIPAHARCPRALKTHSFARLDMFIFRFQLNLMSPLPVRPLQITLKIIEACLFAGKIEGKRYLMSIKRAP